MTLQMRQQAHGADSSGAAPHTGSEAQARAPRLPTTNYECAHVPPSLPSPLILTTRTLSTLKLLGFLGTTSMQASAAARKHGPDANERCTHAGTHASARANKHEACSVAAGWASTPG